MSDPQYLISLFSNLPNSTPFLERNIMALFAYVICNDSLLFNQKIKKDFTKYAALLWGIVT